MVPFWMNPARRSRRPILLSSYQQLTGLIPGDYPEEVTSAATASGRGGAHVSVKSPEQNYIGIRLGPYKYIHYENGEIELYVMSEDPAELESRAGDSRYRRIIAYLDRELEKLRGCKGPGCRREAPPWPAPPEG